MTPSVPAALIRQELQDLVRETFSQVSGHYLDRGTSLLETLGGLDAERASRPGPQGETVAGHLYHLCFYLEVLEEFVTGARTEKVDWAESWVVTQVDSPAWAGLLDRLRAAEGRLATWCQSWDLGAPDRFGGLAVMLVHTAFHLGALRQILDATAEA